jgi:hypothetical protein
LDTAIAHVGNKRRRTANDFFGLARQEMLGLLAHNDISLFGHKAGDQADFLLVTARFIPGDPHAVGMPDFRLAVMRGKLIFGEDELSIGFDIGGIAILLVESIDDQCALGLDRFLVSVRIKHQATAKPSNGNLVRLVENRVCPIGGNLVRHSRFIVRYVKRPNVRLLEVQRRAAR